jgi:hypothetical protein
MTLYDPPWTIAPTLTPYWNIPEASIHSVTEEAHPFGAFVEWENNQNLRSLMELHSTGGTLLEERQADSKPQEMEDDLGPPLQYFQPHEVLLDPAQSTLYEISTSPVQFLEEELAMDDTHDMQDDRNDAGQSDQSNLTDIPTADLGLLSEGSGMEDMTDIGNNVEQLTAPESGSFDNSKRIHSDADYSHRPPPDSSAEPVDQDRYKRYVNKLRQLWLEDPDNGDSTQEIYIPDGYLYVMAERPNSTRKNLYMYGHPSHYVFKSVNEFYWHLRYLIEQSRGSNSPQCYCKGCNPDGYSD